MSPVLWGTLTALGRGSADFASRFSSRALGHANSLLGMLLVGSVVLTLWVAFAGTPLVWTWSGLWLLAVTGVGVMAATLLLYHGLSREPVTVVAPIVGSYPALVVAIALILGSRPTPVQWAAMAAIIAGLIVVARFAPGGRRDRPGRPFRPRQPGAGRRDHGRCRVGLRRGNRGAGPNLPRRGHERTAMGGHRGDIRRRRGARRPFLMRDRAKWPPSEGRRAQESAPWGLLPGVSDRCLRNHSTHDEM